MLKLGEFKGMNLSRLTLRQLWEHVRDISATDARYFLPNIAISITQRVLYKVLHGMVSMAAGPEKAQSASRFAARTLRHQNRNDQRGAV